MMGRICQVFDDSKSAYVYRNNKNRLDAKCAKITHCNSTLMIIKRMSTCKIKELFETFRYMDIENFRRRVIESIDDDQVILIESDHLRALSLLSKDDKDLEEVRKHFKSCEFRERLINDYINVLNDQNELLENHRLEFTQRFPEMTRSDESN